MARKLASIASIATCDPIPDTERLSVATMVGKGWRVVTARGEFSPGDLAVYFEIDSFLPADDERFAFLRERCLRRFVSKSGQVLREGIRIRTAKLRGVISQGLLMPVAAFPEVAGLAVGEDATELLHVEHYDEVSESMRPATGGNPVSGDAYGRFPSDYIPKTDEERIQNLADYFTTMKGRRFEVTEKNDGSSVTMFLSPTIDAENPFGVCSRNLRLKPVSDSGAVPIPWKMAEKYGAQSAISAANVSASAELAFQGELVGPGVNGNRDGYRDYEWHVFRVWDIKAQRFLLPSEARFICKAVGFDYVPVIAEEMPVFDELADMDAVLRFAEGKTAAGHEREGLVFKSVSEPFVSFKAVSNRYLLKEGA